MPYRDDSGDWLYFAESDLKTARITFEEGIYHMTCFHAQQSIEKCLKAILRRHQKIVPKTHSIAKLIHEVRTVEGNARVSEDVLFVDQFYSPTRYPDTLPGSLPEGLPTKDDAQKALYLAEEVFTSTSHRLSEDFLGLRRRMGKRPTNIILSAIRKGRKEYQ